MSGVHAGLEQEFFPDKHAWYMRIVGALGLCIPCMFGPVFPPVHPTLDMILQFS